MAEKIIKVGTAYERDSVTLPGKKKSVKVATVGEKSSSKPKEG